MEKKTTTRVVTIKDLWQIFIYRLWVMVLVAGICVCAFFAFRAITFTPQYSSTATMYILRQANENISSNDASSDFSLALKVVNDCDFLLKSDTVINSVIQTLALDEEYTDLKEYITTKNPSETRILQVTVEADTPEKAKEIVDVLCEIGAENINKAMGYDQVNLYEYGSIDYEPCNKTPLLMYILLGIIVAVAVYTVFLIMFIMEDTLKSDEDCQTYLGISIIGDIPDADDTHKKKYGGYYRGYYRHYGYGYKSKYKNPYQTGGKPDAHKEEQK